MIELRSTQNEILLRLSVPVAVAAEWLATAHERTSAGQSYSLIILDASSRFESEWAKTKFLRLHLT